MMTTSLVAKRRRREVVVFTVVVAVLATLPALVKDVYLQNVLILTLMYAALSQSWNILGGYCGQISLGHVQQINCDRCHDGRRHRQELVPHRWAR